MKPIKPSEFYQLSIDESLKKLGSSRKGLGLKKAEERLKEFGLNKIISKRRIDPLHIFLMQFKNALVLILIAAVIFSWLIGHLIDAFLIGLILGANAVLGFFQEFRAEKALEALKKMSVSEAKVIRNGVEHTINAEHLVPGDIIVVAEGDKIPADARLIECINLKTMEASLTGDSIAVEKNVKALKGAKHLAEQQNMIFMNTIATYGRGKAVVTSTGMKTAFGKIAELITEIKETKTPLTLRIEKLGQHLGLLVVIVTIILALLLIAFNGLTEDVFLMAISLAVSAIPEGLPAVVTITLALGMRAMAKEKSIIRKMSAVEALGSVTTICSDKTGTLTRNEMAVTEILTPDDFIQVSGEGYRTEGKFYFDGVQGNPLSRPGTKMLLKTGVVCNTAEVNIEEQEFIGDPTEIALIIAGLKAGLKKEKSAGTFVAEFPFDSHRKMMTEIRAEKGKITAYCKGSTESIISHATHYLKKGQIKRLSEKEKKQWLKKNNSLAAKGLRVLGFAFKELAPKDFYSLEEAESKLVFLGLMGMIDPLRKESKQAIKLCRQAGIKVKMITGDHKLTAAAIARELNFIDDSKGKVITGLELDQLSDEKLKEKINQIVVFARVTPKHKLRIVQTLKAKGEIVAVTGDGVNDAPALKKAEIGVAMGITGTDVAKEASDMIILDDNFASIVKAIAQGRKIYSNIKSFIKYLLAGNLDELIVVATATLARLPLPLIPVQILWINLVTDGLPALALGNEPLDKSVMKEKPRSPKEHILSGLYSFIAVAGLIAGIATFTGFLLGLETSVIKARTMAFTVCVMFEMFFVFNCRHPKKTFLELNPFSNKYLLLALASSILLQLAVIYHPLLQKAFQTMALSLMDWGTIILLSATALIVPYVHRTAKKIFKTKIKKK